MSYWYIKLDEHKNIIAWGNKSGQDIVKEFLEINNETLIEKDVYNLLQKNKSFRHKYINNNLLNTGEPLFPPNHYSIWDNDLNKWKDPRPQTAIIDEEWVKVRLKRNELLTNSDWTDTLSAKNRLGDELYNAWQQYRQALRDITNQADPYTITWPTAPQ